MGTEDPQHSSADRAASSSAPGVQATTTGRPPSYSVQLAWQGASGPGLQAHMSVCVSLLTHTCEAICACLRVRVCRCAHVWVGARFVVLLVSERL